MLQLAESRCARVEHVVVSSHLRSDRISRVSNVSLSFRMGFVSAPPRSSWWSVAFPGVLFLQSQVTKHGSPSPGLRKPKDASRNSRKMCVTQDQAREDMRVCER